MSRKFLWVLSVGEIFLVLFLWLATPIKTFAVCACNDQVCYTAYPDDPVCTYSGGVSVTCTSGQPVCQTGIIYSSSPNCTVSSDCRYSDAGGFGYIPCSQCPFGFGEDPPAGSEYAYCQAGVCGGGGGETCYGWHEGQCSNGCPDGQRNRSRYCETSGWNSECRVPPSEIPCLCSDGSNPNGLQGEIFNYPETSRDVRYWYYDKIKRTRYDSTMNFDWKWNAPDVGDTGGAQVDPDRFMARWNGYVNLPAAGTWTFGAKTDNVAKVTVNSSTVINTWGQPGVTYSAGDTGVVVGRIWVDFDGPTGGYNWVRDETFSGQAVLTMNDNYKQKNYVCRCSTNNEGESCNGDGLGFCGVGCSRNCNPGYAQPPGYFEVQNLSGSNMVTVAIPEYGGTSYMLYQVDVMQCDVGWTNCTTTTYNWDATGSTGAKNSYYLDFGTGGPSDPWKLYSMDFRFEPLRAGFSQNRGETFLGAVNVPSSGSYAVSVEYSDIKPCDDAECIERVNSEAVLGLYYSGPSTAYQLVPSANLTACDCVSDCSAGSCGQSDGCGVGVCGTGDTGFPSQPTAYNLGTVGSSTTLRWTKDTTDRAEGYQYQIDTGTINETVGINTTTVAVSGYAAGAHTYKSRSSNDTCENVGVGRTYASAWSNSATFCYETLSCGGLACGQVLDCSTCDSTDATAPGTVTIAVPRGATTAPTPYATPSLTLRWDAESSGYTDQYRYQVFRWATPGVGTTMINGVVGSGVTGVGTTIGVGMTGVVYQWKVRAENNTCSGYPAGTTYGGWSTSGYYCWEGETCSLQCGQDRNCPGNGSCASTDATTPGQVTKVAPLGVTTAPTPYTTPSLNLQWNNNESNHSYTDNYRYQVFRWATPGVGTTMINTTVGSGVTGVGTTIGVGMTGVTYEWKIRAENTTCNGYSAGSTYGTWSSSGYYCWEGELCVPGNQCGQARDCAGNGNCANVDGGTPGPVTILSPTGPSISNPTVYNDVSSLNLQWQNSEVGHTYTDFYNYQAIKVGGSNPSNVGTTFYGVGSTVARTVASVGITGILGDIYRWTSRAANSSCSPIVYSSPLSWGYFILNRTPTTPFLTITNNVGTTVLAESYGVGQSGNQICDTRFTSRQARFVVNAYDLDGGSTINEVELKLGATGWVRGVGLTGAAPSWSTSGGGLSFYTTPSTSTTGNRRTVIFPVEMSTSFPTAIYNLTIDTVDMWGRARNDIDTNRDFKNWDCQVPVVSGNLYDSSDTNGAVCPNVGYNNLYIGTSFTSLIFDGPGTDNPAMSVTVPNSFASGGTLTWGSSYLPTFNDNLDMSDPVLGQRIVDLGNMGSGTTTCGEARWRVDDAILSPYSNLPSVKVDFSGIQDQEPWYQAVGGGIRARTRVICNVPPTCSFNPSCRPGMSIDSTNLSIGESDNGLVSAIAIDDSNGCDFIGGDCRYGIPNNWYLNSDIWGENYTYKFLYDKYFGGLGLGVTYPSGTKMSDIGGTGVVFVDGDFEIDTNNSLTNGQFLMIVTRGELVVDSSVTAMSGIVVADGGIRVEGVSSDQLIVSGMLYSVISDINLTRGYTDKSSNNASPAVVVSYRPSLIFNMPADLVKILSGWREGN